MGGRGRGGVGGGVGGCGVGVQVAGDKVTFSEVVVVLGAEARVVDRGRVDLAQELGEVLVEVTHDFADVDVPRGVRLHDQDGRQLLAHHLGPDIGVCAPAALFAGLEDGWPVGGRHSDRDDHVSLDGGVVLVLDAG